MLKKTFAVAAVSIACVVAFAPIAAADNDVPDVKGDSISDARRAIRASGNIMTITLVSPILGCDNADRVAKSQHAVYFAASDRSVVNVKFVC